MYLLQWLFLFAVIHISVETHMCIHQYEILSIRPRRRFIIEVILKTIRWEKTCGPCTGICQSIIFTSNSLWCSTLTPNCSVMSASRHHSGEFHTWFHEFRFQKWSFLQWTCFVCDGRGNLGISQHALTVESASAIFSNDSVNKMCYYGHWIICTCVLLCYRCESESIHSFRLCWHQRSDYWICLTHGRQ